MSRIMGRTDDMLIIKGVNVFPTLQEYLQSRKLALPVYAMHTVSGKAHRQQFVVECRIDALSTATTGNGSSRRKAEQAAADNMLEQLGVSR